MSGDQFWLSAGISPFAATIGFHRGDTILYGSAEVVHADIINGALGRSRIAREFTETGDTKNVT
jgi:hypothetical protein